MEKTKTKATTTPATATTTTTRATTTTATATTSGSNLLVFFTSFLPYFGSMSVPGGPRGGLEDPFFNRPVLESLIYPFWLHFGSILASILGSFWALFLILFSIRFFNDFGCLLVSILGSILAPFGGYFAVKNPYKILLEF